MASLTFNNIKQGVLDGTTALTTGNFYAVLVTTAPTDPTTATRASITEAAGGNYAPVALTGFSIGASGNTRYWTFTAPSFANLTTDNAATVKGMVICQRAGGSPASTDKPLIYDEFTSVYTPNGTTPPITTPANGYFVLS